MSDAADPILVSLLQRARSVLVFTGAGVSTNSGIRDFRGPQGVWKQRQPVQYDAFMSSHAARVEYWEQKLEAWPSFRDAKPNGVHTAVVALERAGRLAMCVTQNIDGLHTKAGVSDDLLVEVHGTNRAIKCQSCQMLRPPAPCFEQFAEDNTPPRCDCGGWLKPATISFGQSLDAEDLSRAAAATERADLVVSLGSTLSVYPAASIPLNAAKRGIPYVVINVGPTDHDGLELVSERLEGDVERLFAPAVSMAMDSPT